MTSPCPPNQLASHLSPSNTFTAFGPQFSLPGSLLSLVSPAFFPMWGSFQVPLFPSLKHPHFLLEPEHPTPRFPKLHCFKPGQCHIPHSLPPPPSFPLPGHTGQLGAMFSPSWPHTWALVTPEDGHRGPTFSMPLRLASPWALFFSPGGASRSPKQPLPTVSPQPLAKRCHLQPRDAARLPESAWKLLFYLGCWSYCAYLLLGAHYPFFHDPPSVFYGRHPRDQCRGLC